MKKIKIYWNGFKLEGSNDLIKAHYSIDGRLDEKECVTFWGRDYNDLPRGYAFNVSNDSDSQTDYFCNDRAVVFPEHPLYKYIRYAALKERAHDAKSSLKSRYYSAEQKIVLIERLDQFEQLENPGQPTDQDLEELEKFIDDIRAKKEAQEREEEEKRMGEAMIEEMETEITINEWTERYPLQPGEAKVTIPFSERRGIKGGSVWSLKAADNIFRELDDRESKKKCGYDKTDFVIEWGAGDDMICWRGRYDIGDNEGGLLKHIFNFCEWNRTHETFGKLRENPPETTDEMETYKIIEKLCNN